MTSTDGSGLVAPRLDVVLRVVASLAAGSVPVALGGSGLLAALGLVDRVRDWDLTTDGEPEQVIAALTAARLAFTEVVAGDAGFGTRARLRVDAGDHDVELIVGFAVRIGPALVPLSTRVTGRWRGLPLGDPAVWATAYRSMGRDERADVLQRWLDRQR